MARAGVPARAIVFTPRVVLTTDHPIAAVGAQREARSVGIGADDLSAGTGAEGL